MSRVGRIDSLVRNEQAVAALLSSSGVSEGESRRLAWQIMHTLNYKLLADEARKLGSAVAEIASLDASSREFVRIARRALGEPAQG